MIKGKIVLITVPCDQGDILRDFLDWHLQQGIDLILAMDGGSTDGSTDILEEYSKTGRVVWLPLPERDLTKYAYSAMNSRRSLASAMRQTGSSSATLMSFCARQAPI